MVPYSTELYEVCDRSQLIIATKVFCYSSTGQQYIHMGAFTKEWSPFSVSE